MAYNEDEKMPTPPTFTSMERLDYLDRKIEKIIYTLDNRIIKIDESLNNLRVEVAKLTSVSSRLDKI